MLRGCSLPRRIRRLRSRRTLTPSLGGARLRNCPNPNLDRFASHLCFFLFRETLWFVCLSLPFHPHRTKPPRRTAADAALEIAIDVSMMHLSF